ncbi:MAG: sigma-70 family RNA polymerase sigma factor [Lentisphaeraceae bacterium]|nr:sigma-70 family RNA polymerase sigma factor [Lentisphaeraceae bacterium]
MSNQTIHKKEVSTEVIDNISKLQRQLFSYILSLVHNVEDTKDVLQETNLVLWRRADTYTAGTNFRAWAYKVALFQVMNFRKQHIRSAKNIWLNNELIEELAEEHLSNFEVSDARHEALQSCIKSLPEERRQLISKRYTPKVTVISIAEELGKSPKAISERLRRIRHVLMKCIDKKITIENHENQDIYH